MRRCDQAKLDGAQIPGAPIDQCRLEEHASCKAMSAFKRTSLVALHMSAFGVRADMTFCTAHVRF